jgi:hypothetical protein
LAVPRIWEVVRNFKNECQSAGWKTSENEDWVHADNQYHNFLWTRTIHPSTFKKIAKASKCAVREGVSYRMVDVAYTAWLFSETPPEELIQTVIDDESLAKNTAVYDMSCLHSSNPVCTRLNSTGSKVFKEFENFLQKKWGVKFKSAQDVVTAEV